MEELSSHIRHVAAMAESSDDQSVPPRGVVYIDEDAKSVLYLQPDHVGPKPFADKLKTMLLEDGRAYVFAVQKVDDTLHVIKIPRVLQGVMTVSGGCASPQMD